MTLFSLRRMGLVSALGLAVLLTASSEVGAQTRRQIERERQRIERENQRLQREASRRNRDRGDRVMERIDQRHHNVNYRTGYDYGYQAGQFDRRKKKYNHSNVYRNTGAYPNEGDPTSADYVYRQGYLRGYEDGFYGRVNY